MENSKKILIIVGPTASGKSALAVKLAKKLNGEVVSADSRQVYRGLDIGTGKITKSEMKGVRHHLLDVANARKQFSVTEWKKRAEKAIEQIEKRGKLPIICGGTGFYIDALLGRIQIPDVPPNTALRARLAKKSVRELFTLLEKLDPRRAKTIDRHNPRRLVRAIEIVKELGAVPRPRSRSSRGRPTSHILIPDRATLRKKIHDRLLSRMKNGMVAEVRKLHARGLSWKRMEELGLEYRYVSRYLCSKMTNEEMVEKLETEIWRYAKRQITWFKRNF